jgi:type II secretory pathway component PulJ
MGPKEKIKEMEMRRDEIWKAIPLIHKEFDALGDKRAEKSDESTRLEWRLSEHMGKIAQRSTYEGWTGWWAPSTSTPTIQQQKVDFENEAAALETEIAANEREREELDAAWNAKREELEDILKELESLRNTAQLYRLPN